MAARVLSYGDVLLRQQDVNLLHGRHWLNDQLITFYFAYLENEKYCGSSYAYCGGSLTYLLSQVGAEDAAAIVAPLKFRDKDLIFFAVNDNPDCDVANGGSHWSLMVFCTGDATFRHFDSAGSLNRGAALNLARKLRSALSLTGQASLEDADFPHQANGYDCGAYALAASDVICKEWTQGRDWKDISKRLKAELTQDAIAEWRRTVLGLIEQRTSSGSA